MRIPQRFWNILPRAKSSGSRKTSSLRPSPTRLQLEVLEDRCVLAPVVTPNLAILPVSASTVIISGSGFDANTANDSVTFDNSVTGSVTAATTTTLTVSLTGFNALTGGTVLDASVTSDTVSSGGLVPVATAGPVITPSSAALPITATTLTIAGAGFDTNTANDSVSFSNGVTGSVTAATSTSLSVSVTGVNFLPLGTPVSASVTVDGTPSGSQQVATVAPAVTSSSAPLPVNASSLTINGYGFDTNAAADSVSFDNGVTGSVTAATLSTLTVSLTGYTSLTGGTALDGSVTVDTISSGNAVQLATAAPVVTSSSAPLPITASSLTIAGFGFDANTANDSVSFDNGVTGSVSGASGTSLTVSVTGLNTLTGGTALDATVTVDSISSNSAQVATAAPVVTASTAGLPVNATALTIAGAGFDTNFAADSVSFNNGVTGSVTGASSTSLTVNVTGLTTVIGGSALDATVTVDGASSTETQVATAVPVLTASTAGVPVTATSLTITGLGFDTNTANDSVSFTHGVTGSVTGATGTSLTVSVNGLSTLTGGTALDATVTVHNESSSSAQVATAAPAVTANSASLPVTAKRLTINGFGFDTNTANDTVSFTHGVTGTVTGATSTTLTLNVSGLTAVTGGTALDATVTVDSTASTSAVQVATTAPVVTPGTVILPATSTSLIIAGFGFDTNTANDTVIFDNGVTGKVTAATSTSLTVALTGLSTVAGGTALNASVTVDGTSGGAPVQVATVSAVTSPTPTTIVGVISGVVFINHNGTGTFSSGDLALAGVTVTITGVANDGKTVNGSVVTDANGHYTFLNVLPGTYQLGTPAVSGLLGGDSSMSVSATDGVTVSAVTLPAGQTVAQNLGYLGLAPTGISERLLLSTTQATSFPDSSSIPGSGTMSLSGPMVGLAIADINVAENAAGQTIDLIASYNSPGNSGFYDPDYADSTITFNTNIGALTVTLYDPQAPQTVANFFDYIESGAYDDSFFSRLVSDFVLQGGGATIVPDANNPTGDIVGLAAINTLPAIPNEFLSSNSNVFGTLAMAQSSGNPNSATDQFFFNIANNSSSLDSQSFTVFGAVSGAASQQFLTNLNNLATNDPAMYSQDESSTAAATSLPSVLLNSVPLPGYTDASPNVFPADAKPSNFIVINSVTVNNRPEVLTFKVIGNTNPALVTTTLTNEQLALSYAANQTGSSTITVQATNQNGASTTTSFTVTVK